MNLADHLLRPTRVAFPVQEVRFGICRRAPASSQASGSSPATWTSRWPWTLPTSASWSEWFGPTVQILSVQAGVSRIDAFLRYPLSFEELVAEADRIDLDGHRILVSSKRHLIFAKSQVHPPRKVDLRDIDDLQELLRGPP